MKKLHVIVGPSREIQGVPILPQGHIGPILYHLNYPHNTTQSTPTTQLTEAQTRGRRLAGEHGEKFIATVIVGGIVAAICKFRSAQ